MPIKLHFFLFLGLLVFIANCNTESNSASELATQNSSNAIPDATISDIFQEYSAPPARKGKIESCLDTGSFAVGCNCAINPSCSSCITTTLDDDQVLKLDASSDKNSQRDSTSSPIQPNLNRENQIRCLSKLVDEEIAEIRLRSLSRPPFDNGCEGPRCDGM